MDFDSVFEALGNETRLKLYTILLQDDVCVCDLTDLLDISQSAISQQLSILEDAELIQCEKRGQWRYYEARPNPLREACNLVLNQTGEKWEELSRELREVKYQNRNCQRQPDTETLSASAESSVA